VAGILLQETEAEYRLLKEPSAYSSSKMLGAILGAEWEEILGRAPYRKNRGHDQNINPIS